MGDGLKGRNVVEGWKGRHVIICRQKDINIVVDGWRDRDGVDLKGCSLWNILVYADTRSTG